MKGGEDVEGWKRTRRYNSKEVEVGGCLEWKIKEGEEHGSSEVRASVEDGRVGQQANRWDRSIGDG